MISTIILIILSSLIIFTLYRLSRYYKPKIIVNTKGKVFEILKRLKSLEIPYHPTAWLINRHIHTIWGMKFRGKSSHKPRREEVYFEDGGQVSVDWFEKENLSKEAPILFIVHTLGGGTRECCTNNFAYKAMQNNYRVLICSCRGCNGSKITSKKLYNGYKTDDLKTIITYASKQFPESKNKYLTGFSLGAMITAQYAMEYEDIDAVLCISHTIETKKTVDLLQQPIENFLYMNAIMKSLKHLVKKSTFFTEEEKNAALKTKTLYEFDDIITSKSIGLSGADEYYKLIRLQPKVKKFKIPIVIFVSEDDPFISTEFIPIKDITESDYCAFITTPEGGHVSFCQGIDGKQSYVEDFALDYFNVVGQIKDNK